MFRQTIIISIVYLVLCFIRLIIAHQTSLKGQIFQVHSELELEVPVEHGLLLENLLDLAHAPFTHTSTFAKGWPVPDIVKFHEAQLLGGNWEPYPIEMSFQPPCMVLSTIGRYRPFVLSHSLTDFRGPAR